jgi:pimeloyl-ACP methyl ester carboxylesterase
MDFAKLLGFALLGVVEAPPMAGAAHVSAPAPVAATQGVEAWTIYGTPAYPRRDEGVVGAGSVVAPPRAVRADPWTSGAVVPIPQLLAAGRRFTVAFWAKAASPETIPLGFQAREAPYPSFFTDRIALTPRWRLFVRSAVAPAALPAGTQAVTLQLGYARSAVTLGPVAMIEGAAGPARAQAAFRAFHPGRVAEAVRIPSDAGVTLAGTLRTPVGHGPGPFPMAICIQGHGPNGRGGFDVLMNRLLTDGIATLEYDKRGIGQSTGRYSEDVDALARDARAAVAAMRGRAEIDRGRIALVGHSQGGVIAPAVAAADPQIAAVVTFAGPVGDGFDLFGRSMHDQLILSGRDEAKVAPLVEAAIALLRARIAHADPEAMKPLETAVMDALVANGFTRAQAAGAMAAVNTDEVAAMSRVHVASDLRSLHVPVLELFGSLDPLVPAKGNADAARAALAHNPAGKVIVFDGLSHWFKEGAKAGSEAENSTLGANLGSPRAVAAAGDWLRDVLAPRPARTRASR